MPSLADDPAPGTASRRVRTEANLERILATAAHLMARRGYEETSIRDVAREAGISLAGMYYYLKGKEDLLYQIQQRTFGSLLEEQEKLAAGAGTAEDKLRRLVCNHLSYLTVHADELKVCTYEIDTLTGAYRDRIAQLQRRYFKLLATVVRACVEDLKGRPVEPPTIRLQTLFVFGMLNWLFMWFDPRRDGPTEILGNRMVDFALHGLLGTS